jgi:hypothetical protein
LAIEGKHETYEERKEKGGKATYSERKSRQIYRTIELPAPVLAEHAQAQLKNGILELKLPKAVKPRQINVIADIGNFFTRCFMRISGAAIAMCPPKWPLQWPPAGSQPYSLS